MRSVLEVATAESGGSAQLGVDTQISLLAAGLIFLLALALGVWKYRQMVTSEDHFAHPYIDIAHRASLMYSFAMLLIAVFVELSSWPTWLNLTAVCMLLFFFLAAIASYITHGAMRDTSNQFEHPNIGLHISMALLIVGEMGGFAILLVGFVDGQMIR